MKMLRSLSIGALAAAAFILAEFATSGMATFLLVAAGIGAGAANAALSIEDYMTKRQLAQGTSGNKELDIISNEQVDSALFAAVAAVRKAMAAVKRTGSLRAVQSELVSLEDYYEIVGLGEMSRREETYAASASALQARRSESASGSRP
jgi:ABC-type transporter Mla MlaB component